MNKSRYENKNEIIENDIKYGRYWNNVLIAAYIINICILIYIFFYVKKFNWLYFILLANAIIFTGIRGIYPVLEGDRKCMHNVVSPFITRSCATIAEISLGILVVLMVLNILKHIQRQNKNKIFKTLENVCYLIISLPVLANMNCWMGVSTNFNLFNVIEESLWAIYAIVLLAIFTISIKNISKRTKKYNIIKNTFIIGIILLILYICYMITIDIPLYFKRYLYYIDDSKVEKINHGLRSMFQCRIITNKYSDWNTEIIWMTSYFTLWMFLLFGIYYVNSKFI